MELPRGDSDDGGRTVITLELGRERWMDRAACTSEGVDPQWFDFRIDLGDGVHEDHASRRARHERAERVCAVCPVLATCSAWAESNRVDGVLGGALWALDVPNGQSRRRVGRWPGRAA
ncbi:WhiB family transcriptional regulator [Rhodococcus sp. NPDC057529]|uniref:WhiB family transcriptional regulator n=1 Tax=Rhodococcus sp. NPDC057529 TaxID=3346158 RepID=UPI00367312B9